MTTFTTRVVPRSNLDTLGNIASTTTHGTTVNRTSNSENQLTQIGDNGLEYDDNGNMTTDESGYTLKYDAWNRLVLAKNGTLTLVAFAYDGQGHRTQETTSGTTAEEYYTSSWQIAQTRVGVSYGNAGTVQSQNVWSPVYVNAIVLRDRDTDANGSLDERLYMTQDANFNVTSVINTSGTVLERMAYTSYGTVTFTDGSWSGSSDAKSLRTLWQGGNWNSWVNSYDFQRRFFSPSLMRWTSADPAGYVDGANWFLGEADNPINSTDPSGLARIFIAFEGLGNHDAKHQTEQNGTSILNFLRLGGVNVTGDRIDAGKTNLNQNRDYILYFNYDGWEHAVDLFDTLGLAKKIADDGKGGCAYNTFVVVGHSLGGGAAWAFSHKIMEKYHFKVNLGFTLDPRNMSDLGGNQRDQNSPTAGLAPWQHNEWGWDKSAAVSWINYFQQTKGFTGYTLPGIGDGNNHLIGPGDSADISHDKLLEYAAAKAAFQTALKGISYSQTSLPQ